MTHFPLALTPACTERPAALTGRTTHAARCAIALLALSLFLPVALRAQDAVPQGRTFLESPDEQAWYLITMSPGRETFARNLAVLETNNPSYRSLANEKARKQKIAQEAALLGLDIRRLRHPDFFVAGTHWLEFVAVKARLLPDAEMEALAQTLWTQMAGKPFMDAYGIEHHPKWEEVRAHFDLLKGSREQAAAAKDWLQRETLPTIFLPLSGQIRDASPFSASLAGAIAAEAKLYREGELRKLQSSVERLLVGKFDLPVEADAPQSTARKIAPSDVETLIAQLSREDAPGSARDTLEQWVKKAIESEFAKLPKARTTDFAQPVRNLSSKERGERDD